MKFTVEIEGKKHEVELDAVPTSQLESEYIPVKQHNSEFVKLREKMKGLVDPEKLLADEEFKTKALGAWKVTPGTPAEELTRAREQIMKSDVEPLKQQVGKLMAQVEHARKRDLAYKILQTASTAGVKKRLLTPPENLPSAPPPIVNMVESYFGYDDEHGDWFARNGEAFAYAAKPTNERPFKGVEEFMGEYLKGAPDLLEDQRQRGANLKTPADSQKGGMVRVNASDPLDFGRNLEAISKGNAVFES